MTNWIQKKLRELNIFLDQEYVEIIAGAATSWFYTPEGSEAFNKLFAMKKRTGDVTKRYIMSDGFNNKREVRPEDVLWFYSLFVKGQPTDPRMLEEIDKPVLICDICGMGAHCPKEVFDPSTGKSQFYCNYCLSNQENQRIKSSLTICIECNNTKCDYWHKIDRRNYG